MTTVTKRGLHSEQKKRFVNFTFQNRLKNSKKRIGLEAFLEQVRVLTAKACKAALPYDDVVNNRNLEDLPRRAEHARDGIVLRGGLGRPGRMVVRKYDRHGMVLDGLREGLPRGDRSLVHQSGRHLVNVDDVIRGIQRDHHKMLLLLELEASEPGQKVFGSENRNSTGAQDIAVREFQTGKDLRGLDRPEAANLAQGIHRRQGRRGREVVRDMSGELEHAALAGATPENERDELLVG